MSRYNGYSEVPRVCWDGVSEFMAPRPTYPLEDPPPYPGEQSLPLEEKLPLRRTEYYPSEDADLERGAPSSVQTRTTNSIQQLHSVEMEPDPLCDLEVEMTNYPPAEAYHSDYYSTEEDFQRPSTSRSGYSRRPRNGGVTSVRTQDSDNSLSQYLRDHDRRFHDRAEGGSEWNGVYRNSGAAMVPGAMSAR